MTSERIEQLKQKAERMIQSALDTDSCEDKEMENYVRQMKASGFHKKTWKRDLTQLALAKAVMEEGVAEIEYVLPTGHVKTTFGTRCPEIILQINMLEDTEPTMEDRKRFEYFDLLENEWRSIGFAGIYRTNTDYVI